MQLLAAAGRPHRHAAACLLRLFLLLARADMIDQAARCYYRVTPAASRVCACEEGTFRAGAKPCWRMCQAAPLRLLFV